MYVCMYVHSIIMITDLHISLFSFHSTYHLQTMRDSLTRLNTVIQSTNLQDTDWSSSIESTKWLTHLRLCLNAAYRTAYAVLREKASVLLHCSHGWDRTSQVASLAQLMIDPYYRTFQGFPGIYLTFCLCCLHLFIIKQSSNVFL